MHVQYSKVREFDKKFVCFLHEVIIRNIKFDDYVAELSGTKYNVAFNSFVLIDLRMERFCCCIKWCQIFVTLIQFDFKFGKFCLM